MIKLKKLINEKTVSMGRVHSNPYASSFKSPKQIEEDGHTDVPSAIRKLKTSIEDANDILNKLNSMSEEESLPSWWTDKITLSANYLNKSRDYILNTNENINEAPEHQMANSLNKVTDNIFKIIKRFEKKADVEAMTRSWMMGLHAKLKKMGIKA